jgi:hypothetical protein
VGRVRDTGKRKYRRGRSRMSRRETCIFLDVEQHCTALRYKRDGSRPIDAVCGKSFEVNRLWSGIFDWGERKTLPSSSGYYVIKWDWTVRRKKEPHWTSCGNQLVSARTDRVEHSDRLYFPNGRNNLSVYSPNMPPSIASKHTCVVYCTFRSI